LKAIYQFEFPMTQGKIVLQIPASVTNTRVKPAATKIGIGLSLRIPRMRQLS
jgi:hypothetical protein